ncbi:hypothetical protein DL95DRAFT_411763 [Leptodontidium sp. 2 PMI_412]|nr:hypothetical protein DL95DRAFT_411763 [Leptodontidium sp. 2 PMI_412]
MAFTLDITPEAYIQEYLDPRFIVSTKSLAYNINGLEAKGFNLKTKNFKQNFGYLIRLQNSRIESVITAGINKEIQDSIYTNRSYKPEILQVFTEVIIKEGYKLPSLSSPKRKASSSFFTPGKARTLIKELNNQINHLVQEFNIKFLEPQAINTTSFDEIELIGDDDFEIFEV